MSQDIPGLHPLWVIDFKQINADKEAREGPVKRTSAIQRMCDSIAEQCRTTQDQIRECQDSSRNIQEEIEHLRDVIDQFRTMVDKYYSPESEEEENEE